MVFKPNIASFDRKVYFYAVTSGKTSMGAASKIYTALFHLWMSREQLPQSQEQYINSRLVVPVRYLYRGYYKSAINENMQMIDGDLIGNQGNQGNQWSQAKYNILSINPIERNMFVEIIAERVIE
jgi:hypothetical protein